MNRYRSKMSSRPAYNFDNKEPILIRILKNQKFLALLALVLLVALVFPILKTYNQRRAVDEEMNQIRAQIAAYEQDTKQLLEMVEYLSSPESAEGLARVNQNMKKPGETVVLIERESYNRDAVAVAEDVTEVSNLQKWLDYFLKPQL